MKYDHCEATAVACADETPVPVDGGVANLNSCVDDDEAATCCSNSEGLLDFDVGMVDALTHSGFIQPLQIDIM